MTFRLAVTAFCWGRRADGRVDIVAEGDVGQFQALKGWCTQGPPSARVSDVRVTESEASVDGFRDFQTQ
ncbi:acylphosphatase [Marinobacter goseongensis]|uniref:acylphosphatase n=1 Tax=Marinobacter goseongensis TaxID=453838 RepID=UPI003D08DC3C